MCRILLLVRSKIVNRAIVSAEFGIAAAFLMALIGPMYGGLILILAFAAVFRHASRVALGWLFLAFTVVMLVLVVPLPGYSGLSAEDRLLFGMAGFIPLGLSGATVLLVRWSKSEDPI